jgi:hypothetical protein
MYVFFEVYFQYERLESKNYRGGANSERRKIIFSNLVASKISRLNDQKIVQH